MVADPARSAAAPARSEMAGGDPVRNGGRRPASDLLRQIDILGVLGEVCHRPRGYDAPGHVQTKASEAWKRVKGASIPVLTLLPCRCDYIRPAGARGAGVACPISTPGVD